MIKKLEGHISDDEIEMIVGIIKEQYKKYLTLIGRNDFKKVFLEEYTPHKRQHSVSWAISSAFPSKEKVGDSTLRVERLHYGRGHTRPVLFNDKIELHILNKTTHFDAEYLKVRYQYNAKDFSNKKLFAYIKFSVENKRLINLSLCLPDQTGKIVEEKLILTRKKLELIAA